MISAIFPRFARHASYWIFIEMLKFPDPKASTATHQSIEQVFIIALHIIGNVKEPHTVTNACESHGVYELAQQKEYKPEMQCNGL